MFIHTSNYDYCMDFLHPYQNVVINIFINKSKQFQVIVVANIFYLLNVSHLKNMHSNIKESCKF